MTGLQALLIGFSVFFAVAVMAFQLALDRAARREAEEIARRMEEDMLRLPERIRTRMRTGRASR
jgi:hypothetical protein